VLKSATAGKSAGADFTARARVTLSAIPAVSRQVATRNGAGMAGSEVNPTIPKAW